MNQDTAVSEATSFLKDKHNVAADVAVVLGSGLGTFVDRLEDAKKIPYAQIPHFPSPAVGGHAGELVAGVLRGVRCVVMSGRVHYYEGHSWDEVTLGIRVMRQLGAHSLLVTNAAGGLNPELNPGEFMVIEDHINCTGNNPLRGPHDPKLGERFPDMSRAYNKALAIFDSAAELGQYVKCGVYAGVLGPCYETPAEVQMLRTLGADAVGMSTVAEVIVANQVGFGVAGLSVITNHAAGIVDAPLSHADVKETAAAVQGPLCDLLEETVGRLGKG